MNEIQYPQIEPIVCIWEVYEPIQGDVLEFQQYYKVLSLSRIFFSDSLSVRSAR